MSKSNIPNIIKKLELAVANDLNVILEGSHGVGKSSIMMEVLDNASISYKYFSASTIDPWTDLVGIPVDGGGFINFIKPDWLTNSAPQVLIFDEFNRSPKKVRNAVMELIQFKSINGVPVPNLRMIWAAINPHTEDEEYDVERLDPALLDRFHIQIKMPEKPDFTYFKKKYGNDGAIACNWWNTEVGDTGLVSPRRLEYALQAHYMGANINDFITANVNTTPLIIQLNEGSFIARMKDIYDKQDTEEAKAFINNPNTLYSVNKVLEFNKNYINFFYQRLNTEMLAQRLVENPAILESMLSDENIKNFKPKLGELMLGNFKFPPNALEIIKNALDIEKNKVKDGEIEFIDIPTNLSIISMDPDALVHEFLSETDSLERYKMLCSHVHILIDAGVRDTALDACFALINGLGKSSDILKYPKLFAIINTLTKDSSNNMATSPSINRVKVQGFLDRHSDKLAKRLRLI